MPRLLALAVLLCALVASGCGGKKKPTSRTGAATTTTQATTTAEPPTKVDAAGCTEVEAPDPKGPGKLAKPTDKLSAKKTTTVTLTTNCGPIVIALDVKRAPKTAASFAYLARKGFFDSLTFHRVVPEFVIQGGDPLGNGQGGPGYSVVEKPPTDLQYLRGVVAMAKTNVEPAGTSGSQFFIVTAEDAGLPPDYALVGKVSSGMKTVDKIVLEPTNPQSFPLNPVVIEKATVAEG
jgi:cyclophilin family peptidyl-prolyl cis-trans isomerase